MPIIDKNIILNIQHHHYKNKFKDKGYIMDAKGNIYIKQCDIYNMMPTSHKIKLDCICDYCNKEFCICCGKLYRSQGKDHTQSKEYQDNLVLCRNCRYKYTLHFKYGKEYSAPIQIPSIKEKTIKTIQNKYGKEYTNCASVPEIRLKMKLAFQNKYNTNSPMKSSIVQENMKKTNLQRYGYEYIGQVPEIQNKIKKTNLERYDVNNVFAAGEIKEKIKQINFERYGYEYIGQVPEIQNKIKKTNLKRYGVAIPAQNKQIQAKIRYTMYKYAKVPTSSQQLYFYNLLKTNEQDKNNIQLNYPLNHFSLDIVLIKERIDIEYNGSGHDLNIKFGYCTQKEFIRREYWREQFIKSQNWKIIKIISLKDKIKNYTNEEYIKMIYIAKMYLLNTVHHWVEIYIEEDKFKTSIYEQTITNILNM